MILSPKNQPVFKLQADAAGCRYEIRLNDIPIHEDFIALPLDVEFPVSEWMRNGENRISLRIRPPEVLDEEGEEVFDQEDYDRHESQVRLGLYVKPNGAPRGERVRIATLNFAAKARAPQAMPPVIGAESSSPPGRFDSEQGFAPDDEGDVRVSPWEYEEIEEEKITILSRTVDLPLHLPRWLWLDAEVLTEGEELEAELMEQYRGFWSLLQSGEVTAVNQALAQKGSDYAAAYYLETQDEIEEMLMMPLLIQSEDVELLPLIEEVWLELFGEGRLARLVDEDGDAPVVFARGEDVGYYCSLMFCKTAEGWTLIR